jgi:serine/threonine protein kinase
MPTTTIDQHTGQLTIDGAGFAIPNVRLLAEVGAGANGIVLRGRNEYLNRDVAVKIWLRLRTKDARDKFRQGVEEIRKLDAIHSPNVPRVYDAGALDAEGKYFYAVIELVHGVTCRKWSQSAAPPLLTRRALAEAIILKDSNFLIRGIVHGDLHHENVLVVPQVDRQPCSVYCPDFHILDFGTSYFSPGTPSLTRHWGQIENLCKKLLSPLNIRRLWGHRFPVDSNLLAVINWYVSFLSEVRPMICAFGINPIAHEENACLWQSGPTRRTPNYPDPIVATELAQLVRSGRLELTPKKLGVIEVD